MNGKNSKVVAFLILCSLFLVTAFSIHPFGEPLSDGMDNYFIEHGQEETASNNVVASVVFDYRGFDTLGEATILFTAVTGVFMLFTKRK
jgi:multisubunit Na+/H+ antiporter MnhB subunit